MHHGTAERGEDVDDTRLLDAEEDNAYIRLLDEPDLHPRQSVGRDKLIQKRLRRRSPLLKTTALRGELTFDDPS